MIHLNVPPLLKIREGITVNLALSVSQSVEKDVTNYRLKEGAQHGSRKSEDYDVYKADTVTFHFIGSESVPLRVGEEITAEDFVRIEEHLSYLQFKPKK